MLTTQSSCSDLMLISNFLPRLESRSTSLSTARSARSKEPDTDSSLGANERPIKMARVTLMRHGRTPKTFQRSRTDWPVENALKPARSLIDVLIGGGLALPAVLNIQLKS